MLVKVKEYGGVKPLARAAIISCCVNACCASFAVSRRLGNIGAIATFHNRDARLLHLVIKPTSLSQEGDDSKRTVLYGLNASN